MSTEARKKLAEAVGSANALLAKWRESGKQSDRAAETVRAAQAELAGLEAQADAAARNAVTGGGNAAAVDDIEAKIAACKRRVAAAEAVQGELAERFRGGQATIEAAQEAARWAARDVLAVEAEALLKRFAAAQREALAMRYRLDGLRSHMFAVRKGTRHNGPGFRLPETLIDRLRDAVFVDEVERWNAATFEAQWRKAEEALMLNPDAELSS
ncbi:MAG: hypothetical protein ACRES9_11730 [Gammaproteobacteria bacterium]